MRRPVCLSAITMVSAFTAAQALAGQFYTIEFPTPPSASLVASAVPFRRDSSYAFPTSNGSGTVGVSGFAGAGYVSAFARLDCQWGSVFSGGTTATMRVRAESDDFIITGPSGGFVSGTLHVRLRADLAKAGGFAGNGAHGAGLVIGASVLRLDNAPYGDTVGDFYFNNFNASGSGCLAAQTDPNVDILIPVSGSFPVGLPMRVSLRLDSGGNTYGNDACSPAFIESDEGGTYGDLSFRGLKLEEVGGQVMTLPAGFTLNSPSWGVVNNHYQFVVGVESPPGHEGLRLAAAPNPSFGTSTVSFEQPQAAHVRLRVFDVGGRLVRTLADEWRAAGTQRLPWDGRTDAGEDAGSGLYFVRLETDGRIASSRIVRVRAGH